MKALIYSELTRWYRLLDPCADHLDEATSYQRAIERALANGDSVVQRHVSAAPLTLLDLGAGAGNNAFHLKRRFTCTLADVSEEMLALSRALNPECEHVIGDMRTLRLHRMFDAVLVHDAVCYMTSEAELHAAALTAFTHTRPGGAAVFAPDGFKESFSESSDALGGDDGVLGLRGMEWKWDPDPHDDTYTVDYALLLRDDSGVRAVHDRHIEGLFTSDTWTRVLRSVGYQVETFARPLDDEGQFDRVFICARPA